MSLKKFYLYVESAGRWRMLDRKLMVTDTVNSIGMALGGKGLKKYLEELSADKDGD
jgi:hypothetical protein